MSGLYIIPILAVLILVHELGHFFAARLCGVKVEEFGIGIPPRLYGRERNGVIWSINAIPFGGFVRVKGEDAGDMSDDSMNSKPPIQRAFFLTAGVMMNLLLAVLLMVAVIGFQGVPHSSVYIGNTPESVAAGSPAAKAGWLPGDRIVSVNGKKIETTTDVSEFTSSHRGEEVTFVIERGGNLIATQVIPRKNPPEGQGAVGVGLSNYTNGRVTVESVSPGSNAAAAGIQSGDVITEINGREVDDAFVVDTELRRFEGFSVPIIVDRDGVRLATSLAVPQLGQSDEPMESVGFATVKFKPLYEKVSAWKVIPRGFQEAYETSVQMVKGLIDTFTNTDRLRDISGPIGMGQATSEIVSESTLPLWVTLAQISIVLSLNLAVLNLLPFPALDGGRLVFVVIEMLRGGRKIAPEKEGMVHFAGIVVLLGVMFVVAFSDIQRLVEGRSLIP
ncbi:RIP metalloprotease RseP [soil metagenome]